MTIQKKKYNVRLSKCCGAPLIAVWYVKKLDKPMYYICECCKKKSS